MQKDLINILFVAEVRGEHIVLERQLTDEELEDMNQRLYHLHFVEMHIMDGFLYLAKDAAELLCLAFRELVDGVEPRGYPRNLHIPAKVGGGDAVVEHTVDKHPVRDRMRRQTALRRLVRREDKQGAVIQMVLVPGNVDIGKAAEDEVHLIAADAVRHGTQIAYAPLF